MCGVLDYREKEVSGKQPESSFRLIPSYSGAPASSVHLSLTLSTVCTSSGLVNGNPNQYHLHNFNSLSCSNSFKDKYLPPFWDQIQTYISGV